MFQVNDSSCRESGFVLNVMLAQKQTRVYWSHAYLSSTLDRTMKVMGMIIGGPSSYQGEGPKGVKWGRGIINVAMLIASCT